VLSSCITLLSAPPQQTLLV
jgi:hypothetical protein